MRRRHHRVLGVDRRPAGEMEIPHAKMLISSFYRGFSIAGLHDISGRDEQC
jgi:hypothetical protein